MRPSQVLRAPPLWLMALILIVGIALCSGIFDGPSHNVGESQAYAASIDDGITTDDAVPRSGAPSIANATYNDDMTATSFAGADATNGNNVSDDTATYGALFDFAGVLADNVRLTAIAIAGLAMIGAAILAITPSNGRVTTNRRMHASETGRWPLNSLARG